MTRTRMVARPSATFSPVRSANPTTLGDSMLCQRTTSARYANASRTSPTSGAYGEPTTSVACEGYLRIKKRSSLTWSTRFLLLRGGDVYVFYSKQDATHRRNLVDSFEITSGKIAPKMELGIELFTKDKREFQARVFSRGDLARWVTAFHRLALKVETSSRNKRLKSANTGTGDAARASTPSILTATPSEPHQQVDTELDTESSGIVAEEEINPVIQNGETRKPTEKRRVSFNGSVMVRMIPALSQEQVPELFYTRAEVERFSAKATSIFTRTEDAVSCAYLSLRRPALPWRKQVV